MRGRIAQGKGKRMFGKGDDTDILSMTARSEARKLAPLRVTEAYWHALVQDGEIPARSAIDPRGMESALENAFLLERIAPSMAKIRVAGSHLSDLMGMDVTGMPLSTLIAAPDRETFGAAVARLFADPAIIRLQLKAQEGFGRPALRGEMILMPLKSDFGEVTRALGAIVTTSRIGRVPRRFAIAAHDIESAPGTTGQKPAPADALTLSPTQVPKTRSGRDTGSMPPRQTEAASGTRSLPQRGHLRLVVSND